MANMTLNISRPPSRKQSEQRGAAPRRDVSPKRSWEAPIALLAAAGIATSLLARYVFGVDPPSAQIPLYAVLAVGGLPLLVGLGRRMAALEFGSDLLAGISIVTSILMGEYLVGSIVVLMLSGGTALEQYATRRASAVLGALSKRMPRNAHRRKGTSLGDVPLEEVAVGDFLVVLPYEACPVDGTVMEGRGTMDESYLTGEPFLLPKTPGAAVLSGAINGEATLVIRADRLPIDSRYAEIMRVMEEAEQRRPRLRRLADRLGAWYTPAAVALAALGWALSGDPGRFLAVLVIATPCPLLIAVPVAMIGAISLAAQRGIVIRNPAALEQIDRCRTLVMDKTGTLTYGRPALTEIVCAPGIGRDDAIRAAAGLEQYSKHPLAAPILALARENRISAGYATEVSEKPGQGLTQHRLVKQNELR